MKFRRIMLMLMLLPALQAAKKPASTAPALSAEEREAAYAQSIEKRAQEIMSALDLKGTAAAATATHDAIVAQYRALREWHDANDAKLAAAVKQPAATEAEPIKHSLKSLHARFLDALTAQLTPAQIVVVKDKMTYNKLRVTYDAYCQIVPKLAEAEKARILALLEEAREEAMDAGSADEKSAIFKKYKGKINNYLDGQGHDVAKAYKDWGERQKAKAAAAPAAPAAGSGTPN